MELLHRGFYSVVDLKRNVKEYPLVEKVNKGDSFELLHAKKLVVK